MSIRPRFALAIAYLSRVASSCVLVAMPLQSQGVAKPGMVRQLRSADWTNRATAFETLNADSNAFASPAMAAELLHLLETEDEVIASTIRESHGRVGVSKKYGEEFGEYHAEVFELCMKRCDKAGLVRLMVHNARQGSESRESALELIATVFDQGFSDEQRDQLSGALVTGATDTMSSFNRYFAMNGIGRLVQTTLVSPQRREDMRRAVIANVTDPLTDNRAYAVQTLGKFRDSRDRPLLTAIAANDAGRTVSHGKTVYPVRGAALAALEKLPPP